MANGLVGLAWRLPGTPGAITPGYSSFQQAYPFEIGSQKRRHRARTASREEKARLWPGLVKMYASYDSYQERTTRDIPVVILSPA